MTGEQTLAIILGLIGLVGGAFGTKLLDRWFERDKRLDDAEGDEKKRQFADNEQARKWLSEQLAHRDAELQKVRESERALLQRVGELAAQVARQEERTNAQAGQIADLQKAVSRWEAENREIKAERDDYRAAKHDVENRLTAESLKRQKAEIEGDRMAQEIERLRGQVAALSTKDSSP